MGHPRENDSAEARISEFGRAYAAALLAAPAGEQLVVALRMTSDLLREAGFDVVMPGGGDRVLISIHETQQVWPGAGYVLGGRGLTSRLSTQPGISVCRRVTEAVETVDALARRAGMN